MICAVGLTCLDIVSFVKKYPAEDSDHRCTSQVWARGGNASNNATVLACLGQPVEYFGTLANDHLLRFFTDDMKSLGIKYDNCPIIDGIARAPASVVICSEETGSRTIVHSNGDLPELVLQDFESKINLDACSWMHFEGRNEIQVSKMIQKIHEYNANFPKEIKAETESLENYKNVRVPISVEVEKCRESLNTLIPMAHVIFVGKDFASWQGAKDCRDAVSLMRTKVPAGTAIICPWGEEGAAFGIGNGDNNKTTDTDIKKIDAFPPTKVIDSLGAGDTFVGTVIFCLNKGMDVETSVRFGCRVASEKLSMLGFLGLKEKAEHIFSGGESL